MDKKAKQIEVLLGWRDFMGGRGHVLPTAADLTKVGAAGELWPPHIDLAVCEPWRTTIAFLLKQVRFGLADPVSQLPDDLMTPSALVGTPTQTEPERLLAALKRWRNTEWTRLPGISAVKESDLADVVRSGKRTAEEIAGVLPPSLAGLASNLAAALAEASAAHQASPAVVAAAAAARAPGTADYTATRSPDEPNGSVSSAAARTSAPRHAATRDGAPPADLPTLPGVARPAAPKGPTPLPRDGTDEDLLGLEFEPYFPAPAGPCVKIIVRPLPAGGVALSWPAVASGDLAVVYRVVSGEIEPPWSPDRADRVTVTAGTAIHDTRPFVSAVRHVQVWCHAGAGVRAAAATQPRLHAEGVIVAPVQNVTILEVADGVVGQWSVLPSTVRVHVYRIPIELAAHAVNDPQYLILPGEDNVGGFRDRSAGRGRRFLYQVRAEATVGQGNQLSEPVSVEILVRATIEPVTDLVVSLHGDGAQFDLSWSTPPAGSVAVYCTGSPPQAGADLEAISRSGLDQTGLMEPDLLPYPVGAAGPGRSTMAEVPWPAGRSPAYFTPVTIIGDRAHVGRTTSAFRIGPILHAKVVERTYRQVLTFAWPLGATSVLVYRGATDMPRDTAMSGRPDEISRDQYVRQGGVSFARSLPSLGCAVHLLPIAFSEGKRIVGVPVSVQYQGLLRLRYHIATKRSGLAGRPAGITIWLEWDTDLDVSPLFVLVHNPGRLPLDVRDGEPVPVKLEGNSGAPDGMRFGPPSLRADHKNLVWSANVKDLEGFIRVFVDLRDWRLEFTALLDPPMSALRLEAPAVRRGPTR